MVKIFSVSITYFWWFAGSAALLFCDFPSSSCMVHFPNYNSQCLGIKSKHFGPLILHPTPFLTYLPQLPPPPACCSSVVAQFIFPKQAFAVPKVPFIDPASSWRPAISEAWSWGLGGKDIHSTWRSYRMGNVTDHKFKTPLTAAFSLGDLMQIT